MSFAPTELTTSLRKPEKLRYDAESVHGILDEAYVCHVGYATDGVPRVLPTAYCRIGDVVYFHGSTGSRAFLTGRDEGVDVCLTVTIHDGIILSRSWFHHSMNYRCVIAHGRALPVTDEVEKRDALAALVDKLAPGRSNDSRPPTDKELAQTAVLALRLKEVSVKERTGGPGEEPSDLDLPFWAGTLPISSNFGRPVPDEHVKVATPVGLPQPS
ncbi:MAG TPA: pyridoxamine 5'-phosphate oxidase family protein [Stackebrandtia sp.]|jgi:nitroimidazol reductase NimA-like FMN-containing flavoprotein (pyridoxamine 5'-phosphate oxidase superfamily)|uniref:pyridoxamine 5'-phosphate oxidase family protein n=1 Tax=Stackebrandtia sp. TaxID=2023065 RepID=UPI002D5698BC|nr:pyridoxamine 5'-phosphate oxidase family protein [Stackebrandtia sp.]HZE39210.1 pyridoxamine 5'-phosphate oxidase family protein [Stackebrandtia sp.]